MESVEDVVSNRVKFILYKILFLTFILEIIFFIIFIANSIISMLNIYYGFTTIIFHAVDITFLVHIVTLMIENNNQRYVEFVKVLKKYGLCICCKWFVNIVLTMDLSDDQVDTTDKVDMQITIKVHQHNKKRTMTSEYTGTNALPLPLFEPLISDVTAESYIGNIAPLYEARSEPTVTDSNKLPIFL